MGRGLGISGLPQPVAELGRISLMLGLCVGRDLQFGPEKLIDLQWHRLATLFGHSARFKFAPQPFGRQKIH